MPKGTPKAIIDKLRAAVIKTMDTAGGQEGACRAGRPRSSSGAPEEFRKVVQDSMVKNAKVVKAVGLKAE